MMMGLYLHDDAAIKRGMAEAEKLLGQKTVGKWYKELSRFMLALVNRDMTEASRSLNTLCENYRYYDKNCYRLKNFSALRLMVFTILPVGC